MKNKAVFPGQYIQGQGTLLELPELVKIFGSKGLIIASPTVMEKILPKYGTDTIAEQIPAEMFRGECCEDELNRMAHLIRQDKIDVIAGMDGGKTIDTAKISEVKPMQPVKNSGMTLFP